MHKTITIDRLMKIVYSESSTGICISCGQDQFDLDPNAECETCSNCCENNVHGIERLVSMAMSKSEIV